MKPCNILLDIDGTVCENIKNENSHLYPTARVIDGAVETVDALYRQGHTITFFTAREEKDRDATEEWLFRHGFKFNALIMGKPRHGRYVWIDDLDVHGIKFNGDFQNVIHELNKIYSS